MAGMNRKLHRTVDFLRIYQRPTKKRKSPTFQSCITVWITDYCIFVQKSRWGNIKTNSYTWKRSWKQACTVSWYQKELHDSYVEYVLLYDTIANRITIDEVQAENGSLRLMKNVWWEYDKLPHMLIAGGTGGGKTYFILTIIQALLRCNAVMYVLDPKNADLADLSVVMPEVTTKRKI